MVFKYSLRFGYLNSIFKYRTGVSYSVFVAFQILPRLTWYTTFSKLFYCSLLIGKSLDIVH